MHLLTSVCAVILLDEYVPHKGDQLVSVEFAYHSLRLAVG
jgi:hypothetical protein